jgi:hypothetical protein
VSDGYWTRTEVPEEQLVSCAASRDDGWMMGSLVRCALKLNLRAKTRSRSRYS